MAFRERTVTGFLVDADGTPIDSGNISFQLDKPLGYTDTHVVINRIFNAVTDALGEFSVTLWCDEDSLVALNYNVSFPTANSGQPQTTHTATLSLAFEDGSTKQIGTLIAQSTPPPSAVPEETWASLIDSRIGAAVLNALGDVQIDTISLANGQVLVRDSATSKWVNSTKLTATGSKLTYETTTEAPTGGAVNIKFHGVPAGYSQGLVIESTDASAFFSQQIVLKSGGYGTSGIIATQEVNGLAFSSGGGSTVFRFGNGSANCVTIGTTGVNEVLKVEPTASTQIGRTTKLAASQTANADVITNSSDTVLSGHNSAGEAFQTLRTPASATAPGVQGTIVWDADFIYICTATNTWKRAPINTW